jgi:hypothetical protein
MKMGFLCPNIPGHLNPMTGYTPLCVYGWPHLTTPEALARNREGVGDFVKLLQSSNAESERMRRAPD